MSVAESQALLSRAARDLFVRWDITTESWRDETCVQFEKKYISVLRSEVSKSKSALENIDAILNRIHADCR